MSIIKDNKLNLFLKLFFSYAVLIAFVLFLYTFSTDPTSNLTDRGAVLTNLLVWSATLFTPISAYFFYDSWKEQHNKTVLSNEAKELWHKFKILENKTYALDEIYLRSGQIQELVYFKSVPDLDKETSDLIAEYDKSYPDLNYFTELANDTNNNFHQNYYGAIKTYHEYMKGIKTNTTIGEIHDVEEELRNNLIKENQNIRKYLSDFILIK